MVEQNYYLEESVGIRCVEGGAGNGVGGRWKVEGGN